MTLFGGKFLALNEKRFEDFKILFQLGKDVSKECVCQMRARKSKGMYEARDLGR